MKEVTNKEYNKSINLAVDYINKHLDEAIDLKSVSKAARISEFHFCRIFKANIGESIGAYVTRLRMERAAHYLQISDTKLTAIAKKTGYQSQHSLSKAFKKHFGITPSAFRNLNTYLSSKTAKPQRKYILPEPEIAELKSINLVYIRIIAKYGSEPDYKTAWKKLNTFAWKKGLVDKNSKYIGLSFDDPNITEEERCRFYACISTSKKVEQEGEFGTYTIEGGRFAVFLHRGSYSGLNDLYQSIYADWVPDNYTKIRSTNSFEKYINSPDQVKEEELLTEIYIPIS